MNYGRGQKYKYNLTVNYRDDRMGTYVMIFNQIKIRIQIYIRLLKIRRMALYDNTIGCAYLMFFSQKYTNIM